MKIAGLLPMLETENLKETIEFYAQHLNFECRELYPNDENPCWASLWNGTSEIAFSSRNAHSEIEKPTLTGSIYLYVEDVENAWRELKDKVEIIYPLEDMNYGMREFGIRDCNGYILNIGQNISED